MNTAGSFVAACRSDLEESRSYRIAVAFLAVALMAVMFSTNAFAQTVDDGNPFNDANDELERYGLYGLVAGGVIMGVIVGVRAGKAIYKTLSS